MAESAQVVTFQILPYCMGIWPDMSYLGVWNLVVLVHTDFTETHTQLSHHRGTRNIMLYSVYICALNYAYIVAQKKSQKQVRKKH